MLRMRSGSWVRAAYDPGAFTVPPKELGIVGSYAGSPFEEVLADREGPFAGTYRLVERLERDGRRFARLVERQLEWGLDVEIRTDGTIGDIVPLPPEEAWRVALALDASRGHPVVTEG